MRQSTHRAETPLRHEAIVQLRLLYRAGALDRARACTAKALALWGKPDPQSLGALASRGLALKLRAKTGERLYWLTAEGAAEAAKHEPAEPALRRSRAA